MARRAPKARKPEGRRICKCECGGQVRGVEQFGRMLTWCEKCSPVVVIKTDTLNRAPSSAEPTGK